MFPFFFWPFLTYLFHPNDCQLFYSVMQLGRNDGACVFEGCLEMCLVYDSGIKTSCNCFLLEGRRSRFCLQSSYCSDFEVIVLKLLYLHQNDLIHAWGLDIQLGYCAQVIFYKPITSISHSLCCINGI